MNLNYSDEQNMLREQVLKFCETNYDFIDREKISNNIKILFLSTFVGLFFVLGPSFNSLNIFGFLCAVVASIGATTMIIINQKMSNKSITPVQINIFINFFNSFFFFFILFFFFKIDLSIAKFIFTIISHSKNWSN